MSGRMSAAEFARLAALPEDHPERVRLADSPEFLARLAMLREFETPSPGHVSETDAGEAGRAVAARVMATMPVSGAAIASGAAAAAARGDSAPARGAGAGAASWLGRWLGGGAPRVALAFATVAIVAASVTWLATRSPEPRATRGTAQPGALAIGEPRVNGGTMTLSWRAVAGADRYRVIFYGSDMKEIARLENVSEPTLALRTGQLPAGLVSGAETLVEVAAMKGADPLATSAPRLIRLP